MTLDQASELRKLVNRNESLRTESMQAESISSRGARVIAIASGKGGVGKTNVAVNLAARLAMMGRRILLLDADLGMANADVICRVPAGATLAHVVAGRKQMTDAIAQAPGGFDLIRGASGLSQMAALSEFERARLVQMLRSLEHQYDLIIVDTAAGISPNVLNFIITADEVLVVTTPEPTAVTDAYGLIKSICRRQESIKTNLLVNMVRDADEARCVFDRIDAVCRRFLGLSVTNAGYIPLDPKVPVAVRYRKLFVINDADCPAGDGITRLAHKLDRHASMPRGHGFFKKVASWLAG